MKYWLSIYEEITPLPEKVSGDERLLRQVLRHLMDNSIKFTEQGGILLRSFVIQGPRLRDRNSEPEQKWRLRFEVVDTGTGISNEQAEDIFKPFYQGEMEDRLNAGTGLGLALSRRLVESMGGCLSVQSPSIHKTDFKEWPGSILTLDLVFGTAKDVDKRSFSIREVQRL